MIKIFSPSDTLFASNGNCVVQPTKAKIHKEDNADYYLDFEIPIQYDKYINSNDIIVANTPQGEQPFRITDFEKTRRKISGKAYHVFYDTKNYLIEELTITDKNCNEALDIVNHATSDKTPFITLSDVQGVQSFTYDNQTLYDAISGFIETYGGHLVRDGFNIAIRGSIGQDNGVTVQYRKNLKSITAEYKWDDVVTKILPVSSEGVQLDETYLYAPVQYDIPYTKVVTFDNNVDSQDYLGVNGEVDQNQYASAVKEDLRQQATKYLNEHCYPAVNYKLDADIDRITDVGDTIEVIDSRLGIDMQTNVISYDYDCITERYTEIEFGTFTNKLSNLISNVTAESTQQIKDNNAKLEVTLSNQLQQAQDKIWNALGSSYVIYEGDKILVVDHLPKEEATNVLMINNGGIAFSNTGINGDFTSAWTLDGTLNMQAINVINLTADLIKGGTLKLGSNLNEFGTLEIYDEANTLIGQMSKDGLKMFGLDGSYLQINDSIGLAGFDRLGNKIYWVDRDEFHMKKSVVEEEITLCNKIRFVPITLRDSDGNISSDGIGVVPVLD